MKSVRIVLGEDHALVREGIRQILDQYSDLKVVGEAGDGQQVLEMIEQFRPDVVIVDIRMPTLGGIEVVRRMKQYCPETKALILTAYDDDEYVLALMEAGAPGYLLKTARANELVNAVRSVSSGDMVIHPVIANKLARLLARRQLATQPNPPKQLSNREREVLELAAKGLRNKAIADSLYISVRTVEGHFTKILTKLNVSSRVEAVLYAISQQWITLEEENRAPAEPE